MKTTDLSENPYFGMREQAMSITPEQLQIETETELYGIVMDWNMGDFIATVVSFITGDASIYLSTGQGFIGGYAHETVLNAAENFMLVGERFLSKAEKTEDTEPIIKEGVDFYFLTKSGIFYIEEDFYLIENGESVYNELFEAGNQVITEYRLVTDNN